ncbi:hypothetical protein HK098_006787 [Nowakowskiella sp. JEL0407]|nr:hypothetical protein HK098_006787 [Nowakowskiella sp. JEL0407]
MSWWEFIVNLQSFINPLQLFRTGFKKVVSRATTVALQTTGSIEKTVDKDFQQEEARFRNFESKVERLHRESKGYIDSIRAMTLAQQRIAETLHEMYPDNDPKCESYTKTVENLNKEITELDSVYRTTVLNPVGKLIGVFPEFNDTIKKRDRKVLDYDKTKSTLRKIIESRDTADPAKLKRAEAEAETAKNVYDEINGLLISEIPKLIDLRVDYLNPSFEAMVKSQLKFNEIAYQGLESVQRDFGGSGRGGLDDDVSRIDREVEGQGTEQTDGNSEANSIVNKLKENLLDYTLRVSDKDDLGFFPKLKRLYLFHSANEAVLLDTSRLFEPVINLYTNLDSLKLRFFNLKIDGNILSSLSRIFDANRLLSSFSILFFCTNTDQRYEGVTELSKNFALSKQPISSLARSKRLPRSINICILQGQSDFEIHELEFTLNFEDVESSRISSTIPIPATHYPIFTNVINSIEVLRTLLIDLEECVTGEYELLFIALESNQHIKTLTLEKESLLYFPHSQINQIFARNSCLESVSIYYEEHPFDLESVIIAILSNPNSAIKMVSVLDSYESEIAVKFIRNFSSMRNDDLELAVRRISAAGRDSIYSYAHAMLLKFIRNWIEEEGVQVDRIVFDDLSHWHFKLLYEKLATRNYLMQTTDSIKLGYKEGPFCLWYED